MRIIVASLVVFLAILIAEPAMANAGLPMVAVFLPPAWLALIPIILIESGYGAWRHRIPLKRGLVAQAAANALSTLIGLPLTWLICLLAGPFVLAPIARLVPQLSPMLLTIAGTAWLMPGAEETWWVLPLAVATLTVPFYLMSVASEHFVIKRFFPTIDRAVLWRWVVQANVVSYTFLLALILVSFIWRPDAQQSMYRVTDPVTSTIVNSAARIMAPDRDSDDGRTALMKAVESGNHRSMQGLIAKGTNLDTTDRSGWTALHLAAGRGDAEAVRILVAAGAEVDPHNRSMGTTPLFQAATNGVGGETIRALLAAGADVDARDNSGWTPLMAAMLDGRPDVVDELIAGGADVNARSPSGWTALKEAQRRGHLDATNRLLRAGAIDYPDGAR